MLAPLFAVPKLVRTKVALITCRHRVNSTTAARARQQGRGAWVGPTSDALRVTAGRSLGASAVAISSGCSMQTPRGRDRMRAITVREAGNSNDGQPVKDLYGCWCRAAGADDPPRLLTPPRLPPTG